MSGLVLVKCKLNHLRGQPVSGVLGNVYKVDSDTALLHKVDGDKVSSDAGCEGPDATELLACGAAFVRVSPPPAAKKPKATKPKPKPEIKATKPKPEPKPEPKAEVDLSALDASVASLERKLKTGALDDLLEDLLAAEEAGKTRKSAVEAIKERLSEVK